MQKRFSKNQKLQNNKKFDFQLNIKSQEDECPDFRKISKI